MSNRLPKPGKIETERLPDGSYLITAYAPRDGAGRPLATDLKYQMTREHFHQHVDALVWLRAGEGP